MAQVNAYVIYDGTAHRYVGDQNTTITINCDRLNAFSPRRVWLLRELAPGDGTTIIYTSTFSPTSMQVLDSNTLQGYWIEQDGKDAMIDISVLASLTDACNACCGSVPTVATRYYTTGIPSFNPLTLNTFCILRLDDGTAQSHGNIALDYLTQIVGGAILISHITGTSHYQIKSFYSLSQLKPIGGDIINSGACGS